MKYIEILWTSKIGVPSFQTKPFETRFSEKHARYSNELCLLLMAISHCTRSQGSLQPGISFTMSCCQHSSTWCVRVRRAFTPTKQCSLVRWMIDESPYMTLCCLSHRGRRVVQIELLSRSLTLRVFRSFPQFSSINKRKHDRSTVLTVAFNDSGLPAIPRYQGGKLGKYKGKLW